MLAAEELEAGEVLFTIPRAALLSQHTSSIQALLQEGEREERLLHAPRVRQEGCSACLGNPFVLPRALSPFFLLKGKKQQKKKGQG